MYKYDVSVIVPVYNLEKYVLRTLNSINNQTFKNIEIVIIDDGSNDNTLNICKDFENKSNFKCNIITKENGGVSSSRNRGIIEANGKYIFFLDGDDLIDKECISKLYNKIEESKCDFVYCGFNYIDENGCILKKYTNNYHYIDKKMGSIEFLESFLNNKVLLSSISCIYKSELIKEYNLMFSEKCVNGEDQEFYMKYIIKSKYVDFVNEELSSYIQRNNSISNISNPKKFQAVSAMKRVREFAISNNLHKNIIELLNIKINKELFTNLNSLIKDSSQSIIVNRIITNASVTKDLKLYCPKKIKVEEIVFSLRYNFFVLFPKTYVKMTRLMYRKLK